jgi:hypothetical protein
MKRALALLGAMTALTLATAGTASAACVPAYCPSPTAVATGATAVSTTTATLNGTINTNSGGAGTWSISLDGAVVTSGTIGDSSDTIPVSFGASGLAPLTTHTYAVSVTNLGSTSTSSSTFSTVAPASGGDTSAPSTDQPTTPPAPPSDAPSQSPTTTPPATTPADTPTTPAPPASKAEKNEAKSALADVVGDGVTLTYSAQVGSALVFKIEDPAPNKKGNVELAALSVDPGAKVKTSGSVTIGGKKVKLPEATTTVGKDGKVVLSVKLTAKQISALKGAGVASIKLKVQVTDQYGTHTKTFTVKVG